MPNKRQQEAMKVYANLMEEVKIRLSSIDRATSGAMAVVGIPSPIVREFCFLQLRMICELIALGCLLAHGDIKATQSGKFQKEYSAQKILEELEKLHPDFYPKPIKVTRPANNAEPIEIEHGLWPHFTKADLLGFYGRTGNTLHRGNVRKVLKPQMPVETNYRSVTDVAAKIRGLLSVHYHYLFEGSQFICELSGEGGKTHVLFAEPLTGPPPL